MTKKQTQIEALKMKQQTLRTKLKKVEVSIAAEQRQIALLTKQLATMEKR